MSTAFSRAADRAHITDIDAKILAHKHSVQVLEAEKMRTQERLNSYAYPVLMLPNEIVSEIFIHFLPIYPSPPPLMGYLSPTALTHICRRWREIAINTPTLWRAISCPRCDIQHQIYEILKSWLSRSGNLPLSIAMEFIWVLFRAQCIEALVIHRARWEYITLGIASESDHLRIQGPMPLLRQFEVQSWNNSDPPPSSIQFHGVPRLRSLTLCQLSSTPIDAFPWAQLTSLTLIYDPIECSVILQHAINLIRCHLFLCGDTSIPASNILLPSLESLVLAQLEAVDDVPLHYFTTLITPALRTLEVSEALLQPDPVDSLRSFISTSSCPLEELCITGDTRSVSEVMYRAEFDDIPKLSFDMSLRDYDSYEEKLAQKRYVVLEPSMTSDVAES